MKTNAFVWFGNDADGLSMVDVLTSVMCIVYIIFKILHIWLSIAFMDESSFITQLNFVMEDITAFMHVIILFYFSKKTIDTTVTKIGLFKAGKYQVIEHPSIEEHSSTDEDATIKEEPKG